MRKTSIFLNILLVYTALFFFSCSVGIEAYQDYTDVTLRQTIGQIAQRTYWTHDVDGSILSSKIVGADGVSQMFTASPSCIFASGAESLYPPVYPDIEGFAVLNTSGLNSSAMANLSGFCNAIVEKKSADTFMDRDSIYSLVIFNYDINREGKKFTSFILGEPSNSGPIIQCPVRFLEKDGFQDVFVYLSPDRSYKIISLEFVAGEKDSEDGQS
ncbi:MAG: hypothetical protein IKQ66_05355 [Treponema sp.]|nr:hypothetical protein [Treponema sp.]